ncbi:MAG: TM2 domain-containing protein [Planctomycetes bacterium]|nr:TM2 domain-containing protein [Planctomycetota bacterium]MCW8134263.1 TM2 domain-containing protein [Planctomycetota bacterium]
MAGSPPPQGYPQQPHGANPQAPYGVDPRTGMPYSDKQKMMVALLQLIGWFGIGGIGRLYAGHTGTGVAQLLLSCTGIGQIWSIIDGFIILTSDTTTDGNGLPLRPN